MLLWTSRAEGGEVCSVGGVDLARDVSLRQPSLLAVLEILTTKTRTRHQIETG
jgi:hypothetical protein